MYMYSPSLFNYVVIETDWNIHYQDYVHIDNYIDKLQDSPDSSSKKYYWRTQFVPKLYLYRNPLKVT